MRLLASGAAKPVMKSVAASAVFLVAGITRIAAADMPAVAPEIPSGPPLKSDEIIKLLDGKSYQFKDYDQPVTGTTNWDYKSHTVSGDYDFAGIKKGTYTAQWTVQGDKSCTTDHFQGTVCQTVYAFGDGFMEVNAKGKVHAVSVPK